jgi:hypothetical protein
MTFKEAMYDIRESMKALSIDSDLTNRQITFLMRLFRSMVIRQFITNNPGENRDMLTQTLHMELELVDTSRYPEYKELGFTILTTKKVLPNIISPQIYKDIEIRTTDRLSNEIEVIGKNRVTEIQYAPKGFIYAYRDDDGKIYIISKDIRYKNVTSINVTTILEDPESMQDIHNLITDLEVYPITSNLWINVKELILKHISTEMMIPIDTIKDNKDNQLTEKQDGAKTSQ